MTQVSGEIAILRLVAHPGVRAVQGLQRVAEEQAVPAAFVGERVVARAPARPP